MVNGKTENQTHACWTPQAMFFLLYTLMTYLMQEAQTHNRTSHGCWWGLSRFSQEKNAGGADKKNTKTAGFLYRNIFAKGWVAMKADKGFRCDCLHIPTRLAEFTLEERGKQCTFSSILPKLAPLIECFTFWVVVYALWSHGIYVSVLVEGGGKGQDQRNLSASGNAMPQTNHFAFTVYIWASPFFPPIEMWPWPLSLNQPAFEQM